MINQVLKNAKYQTFKILMIKLLTNKINLEAKWISFATSDFGLSQI
jgi:hypothetical protein